MSKDIDDIKQEFEVINELINSQDIDKFETALNQFIVQNEFPYEIEESKIFAKRIIKSQKEGTYRMKKSFKVASLISVCLIGTAVVYASGVLKKFTFLTNKGTAIVKTTDNLTEKQAQKMVEDLINLPEEIGEDAEVIEPIENHYTTIEEAEKALDFAIILPNNIPEAFKEEKEVMVLINPETEQTFVYVIFDAITEEEHSFLKIDIVKEEHVAEGTSIAIRESSDEIYRSKNDVKYEIFKERDESTNDDYLKAKTYVGEYEYGIFVNGIDEATFYDIIDSVDISEYGQMEN